MTGNYTLKEGNTKINMQRLCWHPLEERRAQAKVLNLYKAMNGTFHIPLEDITQISSRTRSKAHLAVPHSSVNAHLYSYYRTQTLLGCGTLSQHLSNLPALSIISNLLSITSPSARSIRESNIQRIFLSFIVTYKHTPFLTPLI